MLSLAVFQALRVAVLTALLPAAAASAGGLRVGLAAADVTPDVKARSVWLAGFGRGRMATSAHGAIAARAAVLADGPRKVALVSVDVVGLFRPFCDAVRKQFPEFTAVVVSSTHNHEGPDTMGIWGPNLFTSGLDKKYMARLKRGIVKAIRDADRRLQPAEASVATADLSDLIRDSRRPVVKHGSLTAIRFTRPGGRIIGTLAQWNNHPECLGSGNRAVSADFPGFAVRRLEAKLGGTAVYVTGTVGGLMTPLGVAVPGPGGKPLIDSSMAKTRRLGELVAGRAAAALKSAKPLRLTPFRCKTVTFTIPVTNQVFELAARGKLIDRPQLKVNGRPAVRTEVSYWRLGELGVACLPGEVYPELVFGKYPPRDPATDFPDAAPEPAIFAQMKGVTHRITVGLANDELGYIMPKRQWDREPPFGFGCRKAPYGEVNSVGPEAGPAVCDAFRRAAGR